MNRLLLLLSPVSSVLAGYVLATWVEWIFAQVTLAPTVLATINEDAQEEAATPAAVATAKSPAPAKNTATTPNKAAKAKAIQRGTGLDEFVAPMLQYYESNYNTPSGRLTRIFGAFFLAYLLVVQSVNFYQTCHAHAEQISQPSIMFKAKLNNGETVMINDYQETYWWVRDNTPRDSRILSWWDYGYQINGIANRTSLADGNTWNLEHIALLGRMLTANEKKAHGMAKHVADYVLVWAGGGGDDLGKSPHMARIASSVYDDVCPRNDPLCGSFRVYENGQATPSMAASMLYKMHSHGRKPGVSVNPKYFREAFTSKYGLCRVFEILNVDQESKKWLADPANRKCDAPGSWYCVGQYPPGFPRPPKTHRHLNYDNANKYVEDEE